jgi:hypothetical protein
MQPQHPEAFAAFVGLDWANAKHDICLQATGTPHREFLVLEYRPEAIDTWVQSLRTRFHGHPVAVCLELNKGPIVSALRQYEFLVLFPVNPLTVAKYRKKNPNEYSARERYVKVERRQFWSGKRVSERTTEE